MANKDKGGGARKYDRHRKSGQNTMYKAEHRHEMSRLRRIIRHLARHPNDACGRASYKVFAAPFALSQINKRLSPLLRMMHDDVTKLAA